MEKFIDWIREKTPLNIRIKYGRYVAYCAYYLRTRVFKNSWKPKVLGIDETIDYIRDNNLSAIRLGDGEISLFNDGATLAFQEYNKELAEKLKLIIKSNNPKLLICLPGMWDRLDNFAKVPFWFTVHYVFHYGNMLKKYLNYGQIYGDTLFTRPYLTFKDRSHCGKSFENIRTLWKDKDVVLIEGSMSRLGVGNNLFDTAKSMQRILGPAENAYSKYNEILEEAKKVDKNKLIVLSLGPTAKALGYDLFNAGYRVLDVGHVDMEYEMFLRKEAKLSKVEFKYFNECDERSPADCTDPKYLSEIIATIK